MAVYKIFPEKSATIYSFYPTLNTGIDEILELSTFESINNTGESSRILLKFPTSEIQYAMDMVSTSSFASSLKLNITDAFAVPLNYTLEAYALSSNWNQGTGRLSDVPNPQDGAGWTYRSEFNVDPWFNNNSGYPSGITASYNRNVGGGNWYTSPSFKSTQQFGPIDATKDTNFSVTQIVNAWYNNVIPNYGFILKHSSSIEFNTTSSIFELKFFSGNTHTIYPPCLEIKWDDTTYNTGSLSTVTSSYFTAVINNNNAEYQQDSVAKFRIAVRDLYPSTIFRTSLSFSNQHALPSTSYWSIKDLDTEEIVVDYDTIGTKIGCDEISNYFTVYMNGLEPERYYKILIKTILPNGETIVSDKNYIFKVIR
jgi:hypothetical protein